MKQLRNPKNVVLALGGLLIILSFFLPWLRNSGIALTGLDLARADNVYLFAIPIFGAAICLCAIKGLTAPLLRFILALGAFFIVFALFALTINIDEGSLVFTRIAGESYLTFSHGDVETQFHGLSSISLGFHIGLIGILLAFLSPALGADLLAKKTMPEKQHGKAKNLEELRPGNPLRRDFRTAIITFAVGVILIFTYSWCGISPLKIWQNRSNAREHLFGRELSKDDKEYINDQVERAPEIEAQGRARAFMDNKYREVPFDQQPGLMKKMKEQDRMAEKFLAEMDEKTKERLRKKARTDALDEKRGGYFPPENAWPRVKGYLVALLETIAIAVWGTLLALICSIPAAILAAENTLKLVISGDGRLHRAIRWFCVTILRRFLDACRGFNELVMALIFVAVIGLGPFAGILALWIHTLGILGKVFSEQIETIDEGQIEALSSTGATVGQIISYSVIPQVMPGFVSYTLLRFESNVRSAAILGYVGAGGIGFLIQDKVNGYLYREVCTIMIIIIVAVGIIDHFCKRLRKQFT